MNLRKTILLAIITAIMIAPLIHAYNPRFEEEIDKMREDLRGEGIGAVFLDRYEELIRDAVASDDEQDADRLFDEARWQADEMIRIKENATSLRAELESVDLGEDAEKKLDEALFELGSGNRIAADKLLKDAWSLAEGAFDRIRLDSVSLLEKTGYKSGKIDDAISYGKSIDRKDFDKIVLFKKESESMIDAISTIENAELLKTEYEKISEGKRFENGIEEMKLDFELGNYGDVKIGAADLRQAFTYANKSASLIAHAESQLYTSEEAMAGIKESKEAFGKEMFFESFSLIEKAVSLGESEKSKAALASQIKDSLPRIAYDHIVKNSPVIIPTLLFIAVIVVREYPKVKRRYLLFRIDTLEARKKAGEDAIRRLQEEHYIKRKVSKKAYETRLAGYQKKMVRILEKKARIVDEKKRADERGEMK